MTEAEKRNENELAFIHEYMELCNKYNTRLTMFIYDEFGVEEIEEDEGCFPYGNVSTTAEREERYRIKEEKERIHKEDQQREWEEQYQKRVEAYVAGGGELDENGKIPVSPNYCQLIYWQRN